MIMKLSVTNGTGGQEEELDGLEERAISVELPNYTS